jgi:argininosuccinate lyase
MEGLSMTRGCLAILPQMIDRMGVNPEALIKGFSAGVFATDRALELVGQGMPFRDAYHYIKANLGELDTMDPYESVRKKTHLGAPMGLDFGWYQARIKAGFEWRQAEWTDHCKMVTKLMGVKYPIA